ncbi:hypothetical protein Tco_0925510 [Tanacetum coccineum]|uniref:Uncharacterized protein n=1 Tax=Tanacetum coccineum TaxID=301880 RepID=A0ABQ5D726_9ASTR
MNVEEESSKDPPIHEWKDYEHTTYIETNVHSNQSTYNDVCQIYTTRTISDDGSQNKKEWFDEHELMEDADDEIGNLEDYLNKKEPLYYVNEENERSKERRCKLLRIPYVKPPTFKYKKFKVIKYSFRPVEEYVAIKEYEYDIWV